MIGVSREELIDEAVRRFADSIRASRLSRAALLRRGISTVNDRDVWEIGVEFRRVCEERGVAHA